MTGNDKNSHYTLADIEKYLNGELSATEMHEMERASLEDPFLEDALEGMEKYRPGTPSFGKDLAELGKRLETRIGQNRIPVPLPSKNYVWRTAAAIILLVGVGTIAYMTIGKNSRSKSPLAVNKEATTDTAVSSPGARAVQTTPPDRTKGAAQPARPAAKPAPSPSPTGDIAANTPAPSLLAKGKTAATEAPTKTLSGIQADSSVMNIHDARDFRGRVLGADGKPIAFASIALKNQPAITATDSNGVFSLHLTKPDSLVNIVVHSIGYNAFAATLRNNNSNEIRLQPNATALNEVVVTGYGLQKEKKVIASSVQTIPSADIASKYADDRNSGGKQKVLVQHTEPSVGWTEYNGYLERNKKIGTADSVLTGNEVISFLVDRKGGLSSFRIEKSLSPAHDAEATRLIMQGPAWRLLKGKKERATVIVSF